VPDGRGRERIAPLLAASLLVHLALMFAVVYGGRREVPTLPQSPPIMVDLEPGGRREPAASSAAAPPQGWGGLPAGAPATPVQSPATGAAAAVPALTGGAGSAPITQVSGGASRAGASVRTSPESGAAATPGSEASRARVQASTAASASAPASANVPASVSAAAAREAKNAAGATGKLAGGAGSPSAAGPGVGSSDAKAAGAGSAVGPSIARPDRSPISAPAGDGAAAARRGLYQAQLKKLVEAHKEYPVSARKLGREGSCLRRFVLGRDGALQRVESLSSCGHPFLDGAATRAITAVGKFPPLPEDFGGAAESFTVTMTFTLAAK
jgi:TonB family protein